MTPLTDCPACGGRPLHGWGSQAVQDPAFFDGGIRFVEGRIPRRRCAVCKRSHLDPGADPARLGRIRDALRFMIDCAATDGIEAAAAHCGLDRRTLSEYVEAELDRMLSTPVTGAVFLGAVPGEDGAVVLGEAGGGRVLDALERGTDPLGETLNRRGGDVGFAWIPMQAGVRQAVRDVIPDATRALCRVEAARLLDKVLDSVPPSLRGEVHVLRHATGRGWTLRAYEGLKGLARKGNMKNACMAFGLWDEEIVNALEAPAPGPAVGIPDPLHGLRPIRFRGFAAVMSGPTLSAMSDRLVLHRTLQRQP